VNIERNKPGRKADTRRVEYGLRFGFDPVKLRRILRKTNLDQLDACMNDEARRILLGRSSKTVDEVI